MKKVLGYITITAGILQIIIILLSWMITAAWPEMPIRSLLSSEGIRWFFGAFSDNLENILLIWTILLVVSFGVFYKSKLFTDTFFLIKSYRNSPLSKLHYREKVGYFSIIIITIVFIIIIGLLTLVPHAILLSVLGTLFPSSFSASIVPIFSFYILVISLAYGYITRTISSVERMYDALMVGPKALSYTFPLYIAVCQLIASIEFVLNMIS